MSRPHPHLTLVVDNPPPILPRPATQPPRRDFGVVRAARAWAEEMHVARLTPDVDTSLGSATLALLDALHDLDHFHALFDRATDPGL